ncbi:MAG TPA: MFS transporter [Candidatus Paceibacterota bacterium]|nr:MFS transporter [Candidatus Paceibacterota bacterium]
MENKRRFSLNQYADIIILTLAGGILFFGWQASEHYFTAFYKTTGQLTFALKALSLLYGVVFLGNIAAPFISSKIGLKKSLVLGFFSYPLFILAIITRNVLFLYTAAICLGLGAGLKGNVEVAYIGAVSPKEKRGSFNGFYRAGVRIGATLSLVFGSLYLARGSFINFYFILTIIAFLGFLILLIFLREPKSKFQESYSRSFIGQLKEILKFVFDRRILLLFPSSIATGWIFGLITAKIPLTIQNLYGASYIGLLLIVFQITRVLLTHPMGAISDKIGRFKMLYLEILIGIVGGVCFLLSKNIWVLAITLCAFGVDYAIKESNGAALSLDLFEEQVQKAGAASSIISTLGGTIPSFLLSAIKSDNYLITVAIIFSIIGLVCAKILETTQKRV